MAHNVTVGTIDLTSDDGVTTTLVRLTVEGEGGTVTVDLLPDYAFNLASAIADRADKALAPYRPEVLAILDGIDAQTPPLT